MVHEKRNASKVALFELLRWELADYVAVNGRPIVKVAMDVMAICICDVVGGLSGVCELVGGDSPKTIDVAARGGVEEKPILPFERRFVPEWLPPWILCRCSMSIKVVD